MIRDEQRGRGASPPSQSDRAVFRASARERHTSKKATRKQVRSHKRLRDMRQREPPRVHAPTEAPIVQNGSRHVDQRAREAVGIEVRAGTAALFAHAHQRPPIHATATPLSLPVNCRWAARTFSGLCDREGRTSPFLLPPPGYLVLRRWVSPSASLSFCAVVVVRCFVRRS